MRRKALLLAHTSALAYVMWPEQVHDFREGLGQYGTRWVLR